MDKDNEISSIVADKPKALTDIENNHENGAKPETEPGADPGSDPGSEASGATAPVKGDDTISIPKKGDKTINLNLQLTGYQIEEQNGSISIIIPKPQTGGRRRTRKNGAGKKRRARRSRKNM